MWTGVSAGMFIAILILGGCLWGMLVSGAKSNVALLAVPAEWFPLIGLALAGYLSCMLVLPTWSQPDVGAVDRSSTVPCPQAYDCAWRRNSTLPLLLIAAAVVPVNAQFMEAVALTMALYSLVISLVLTTVKAKLWELHRYSNRRHIHDLLHYLCVAVTGIGILAALFVVGLVLLFRGGTLGQVFYLSATLGVLSVILWTQGTISFADKWAIQRIGRCWAKVEGVTFSEYLTLWSTFGIGILPVATACVLAYPIYRGFHLLSFDLHTVTVFFMGGAIIVLGVWLLGGMRRSSLESGRREALFCMSRTLSLLRNAPHSESACDSISGGTGINGSLRKRGDALLL